MSRPLFRDRDVPRTRPGVPIDDATLAARLESLANFRAAKERRDKWRRAAGTDGNGHAERHNPGDAL